MAINDVVQASSARISLEAPTLVRRLRRRLGDGEPGPWYTRPWATLGAMYAFMPLGLYLMWRYRSWPRWLKWANTVLGPLGAALSTYGARGVLGGSLPLL
ncbi:MAG: hypothetical protein ACE5IZ_01270 [Dehalococcoidia bacterium]